MSKDKPRTKQHVDRNMLLSLMKKEEQIMMIRVSLHGDLRQGQPKRMHIDSMPLQQALNIVFRCKSGDIAAGNKNAMMAVKLAQEIRQPDARPRMQGTCSRRRAVDDTTSSIEHIKDPWHRSSECVHFEGCLELTRNRRTDVTSRVQRYGAISESGSLRVDKNTLSLASSN